MANCQHCVSVIIIRAKLVNNKPKQEQEMQRKWPQMSQDWNPSAK